MSKFWQRWHPELKRIDEESQQELIHQISNGKLLEIPEDCEYAPASEYPETANHLHTLILRPFDKRGKRF